MKREHHLQAVERSSVSMEGRRALPRSKAVKRRGSADDQPQLYEKWERTENFYVMVAKYVS